MIYRIRVIEPQTFYSTVVKAKPKAYTLYQPLIKPSRRNLEDSYDSQEKQHKSFSHSPIQPKEKKPYVPQNLVR